MIPTSIHKQLWLGLGLTALLVACGPGKPTISLSATPAALEDGQVVTLKAVATGAAKVEFYKADEKIGEDTSAPYELDYTLNSGEDATIAFTAKAIADNAQSATSEAVNVQVKVDKEAPKVEMSASSPKLNAAGSITLTARATDNKGVVKVEFFKGSAKLGESTSPTNAVYSFNVALSASDNGTHKYSAKAFDKKGNMGMAEVSVEVDIDVTKPTISLASEKTNVTSAGNVTLTATATDNVGVTKVEFFKGADKIGEDTAAPFTLGLSFTAANNGNHTYSAKAYDAKDNSAESGSVSITVDIDINNPIVSLSANKTSVTQPGPVLLTANAQDDKGVSKVEFYETGNASPIHTDSDGSDGFKHEVSFTAANNGTHIYTAKAFDAQGNHATSAEVSVGVDIDETNPTVTLAASPTSLSTTGTVTLTADALDNKGVSKVEFFKNGSKIGEDATAVGGFSFPVDYTTSYKGKDSFSAKAYDSDNNMGTSNTAQVDIDIDIDNPTISLIATPNPLSLPGAITLTAASSDNQAVTKLEFYQVGNSTPIKTVNAPVAASETHTLSYTHEDNGKYFFTATAYDAKGNTKETSVLTVLVEFKPVITVFGADVGYSLDVSDAGGFTHLKWDGTYVVDYHHSVSPDNTAWVDKPWPDNTRGRVYTAPNYTNQPRIYTLKLIGDAYDNQGLGIPDAEKEVTLTVAADTTAPLVGLSSSSTNVTAPASITLTATAKDLSPKDLTPRADGFNVEKVEFFKGNTLVHTDFSSPYEYTPLPFAAANNGIHTYTAKATDNNGFATTSVEVNVTVNIGFSNVVAGSDHTCGIGSDSKAYCWGYNAYGQLGDGTTTTRTTPVAVSGLSGVSSLAAGEYHTCGIVSDGTARCWGRNNHGQLGDGTTTTRTTPVAVSGLSGVSSLAAGALHTCGIVSGGTARCWGLNINGQLGDGTTTTRTIPVLVTAPW